MEKEVKQLPAVLNEHYEVEFIEDSEHIYQPGDQINAIDLIDDYCNCDPPGMKDVSDWLYRIPVPRAIAFIAEAWGIGYKLHLIRTTDEIVN